MDISKVFNFTFASPTIDFKNEEHLKYVSPFFTATSVISIIFLCFIVEILGAKIVKQFTKQQSKKSTEESTIKSVSCLSIIKHFILCRLDLLHTSRSLLNTYGLTWKVSFFGIKDYVCLHDPAMLQKLYPSWDPGHLHKPNWFYSLVLAGPLKIGLTSSRANVWKQHRNAVCKGFSYSSLRNQVKLFNEHGKKLVFRLNDELFYSTLNISSNFHSGSLSRIVHETAFDITTKIASGKSDILTSAEIQLFHDNFNKWWKLTSFRLYHPWLVLDILWSLHPKGREAKKVLGIVESIIHKIFRVAKEESLKPKETYSKVDDIPEVGNLSLVDEMIKGGLSEDEIYAELFTFLITGHDTVSMTLNLTLFHLAANSEYQKYCAEEVDQLFGRMKAENQSEISMEALSDLKYLDRCIKEELRLYPTTPLIGRQIEKPIILDKNTTLKAGTTTLTALWLLHRNPDNFPDPEIFDPDRFLPENCKQRRLCEYMPFSTGPRNCIGWKSGTFEVKILLAYILHKFELSTNVTVQYARDAFEKCIWPAPELPVRLKRRR